MSDAKNPIGAICWTDLTIPDADAVRDFYSAVIGWSHSSVKMGDYDDYCMNNSDGDTVAGICHARGGNAGLPAQWLIYVNVDNIEKSIAAVETNGGKVLQPTRNIGGGKMAVIQDPAGACMALFEQSNGD